MHGLDRLAIVYFIIAFSIDLTLQCPYHELSEEKAAYKSGIHNQSAIITLDNIKQKLKESGIFDWQSEILSEREKKELGKLFDAVEIMTTSRNRQPSSTHNNMGSSLRLVERAVNKQLKDGQISKSLASKFHWDRLVSRSRRNNKPTYYLDKKTNMRIFYT